MMKKSILALLGLVAVSASALAQPKLVVGIVVDQMRWDYLERYADRYCEGGFKRMMSEGYNCTQCMINYLPAVTAVGHASVYTGTVPAYNGIVANYFLVDDSLTSSVDDANVQSVGTESKYGKESPHLLLPTTMTDELQLATNFRSKVVGVALKDRAAILPSGHCPTGAYWLDGEEDNFITSTWYMEELPQWVKDFNARKLAKEYMKRGWPKKLMYADDTYVQSHPRDPRCEIMPGDGIRTTPWGATLTLEMAKAAIEGEQMGQDDVPDFLAVSISSTDAIAHRTGCNSPYMEDAFLWLDRDLESFFNYLDEKVGKGQWTAFLTADHAGQHSLQFRMDHQLPAMVWENTPVKNAVDSILGKRLGTDSKFVKRLDAFKLTLDKQLIAQLGGDVDEVTQEVCDYLLSLPQVQYAFDISNIPDYVPAPLPEMLRNGYNPQRTGSIQIVPKAGVMEAFREGAENLKGASHALWTPDDTHIPLVFMGYGVPQGKRDNRTVHIVDIASTVCSLLHIQQPSACVGSPIF